MSSHIYTISSEIQAIVKELSKDGKSETEMATETEKLLAMLEHVPPINHSDKDHLIVLPQVESCAVTIWNLAVAKKTNRAVTPALNARMRHVACNLIYLCHTRQTDVETCRRQIMMAMKTARAWLDSDNASMADNPLSTASESLDKLRSLLKERISGEAGGDAERQALENKVREMDRDFLKLLCYKAEAASGQGHNEKAQELIRQAKEELGTFPEEGCFMAMLCYNFGVETFQKKQYELSVSWLRDSFEIGKGENGVGSKAQARTLRLLANAYLEWDSSQHWQKALNAVGLANAEHGHPAGLYLKLRILLLGDAADDILHAGLDDMIRHTDVTIDMGLTAVKLALLHNREKIAFECLGQLSSKFQHSAEIGSIWAAHFDMLIETKKFKDAQNLMETIVKEHNSGQPLDVGVKKRLHLILWEKAAEVIENKNFDEALIWYNQSLALFGSGEQTDQNLGKLHRNRTACFIGLDNVDQASESLEMAVKCDDGSPYTHYLSFKIALMKTDEQQALVSLEKMASTLDRSTASGEHQTLDADVNIHGFICLAAQLAFEQSNRVVALRALEHLVKHSPSPQQVLTSLRCLTRLRLTSDNHTSMAKDRQALVTYLKSALTELLALTEKGTVMGTNIQEEASWFMKIAWNMALQCEDSPQEMHGLFILCSKLSGLCDVDMACLVRQKTCMLMAAAASLQVARQAQDKLHKRCALQECIANIDGCLCVCARIQDYKLSETASQNKDLTTPVLLLLYEFEAKIGLEEDDAERVLEKALLLPQAEPKAFETMAALAMGPSGRNRALGVRALKIAIKKHLQQPRADFEKCSKAFHSLVEVALQGGSSTDPASREEAWGYYMDVVDVIENKAKGEFPEMEVLWLMTKAWNCGVHLFSAGRYSDAEQWCELGMRLLKQLTTLHSNYEAQMKDLFGEIKTKIDAKKGIISN